MVEVDDADLEAVVVPSSVKIAGAVLVLTGLFTTLIGLQVLLVLNVTGLLQLVAPFAILTGVTCGVLGAGTARGGARSALLGMGSAGVACVFALAWFVFALLNGVLSPLALAVLPLSTLSVLLLGFALKHTRRIEAARVRLRAQGLDAGL